MEKLNANVVALTTGITASIISVVCLIFISISPLPTVVYVANNLVHSLDFSSIATKSITLAGLVMGVILWFIIATAAGYIFAIVYNWIGEKF